MYTKSVKTKISNVAFPECFPFIKRTFSNYNNCNTMVVFVCQFVKKIKLMIVYIHENVILKNFVLTDLAP